MPALVRRTKMPSKRASSASLPASISNALPAPVGAVADQCLLAARKAALEAVHHGPPVGPVLLRLCLVAAHDIARAAHRDFLHEQCKRCGRPTFLYIG
jgi:hypothetical protein